LQALPLTLPGLQSLLGLAPITLLDGAVIGTSAVLPLVINESTKRGMPREARHASRNGTAPYQTTTAAYVPGS
jgi:hypothetical protein